MLKQITDGSLLLELYAKYGEYAALRSMPSWDGLLLVERRLLLTGKDVCLNKFVKSSNVVGTCMATLHPHSDASIYGTLVRMVKAGFFDGQGNFGAPGLVPIPPAAMRYTEVRLKSIMKPFFEYLPFVPKVEFEASEEPAYLPAPFPLLLGDKGCKLGLSFFKSSVPVFDSLTTLKTIQLRILGKQPLDDIVPYYEGYRVVSVKGSLFRDHKSDVVFEVLHEQDDSSLILYGVPSRSKITHLVETAKLSVEEETGRDGIKIRLRFPKNQTLDSKTLESILRTEIKYEVHIYDLLEMTPKKTTVENMFVKMWELYVSCTDKFIKWNIAQLENKLKELDILIVAKEVLQSSRRNIANVQELVTEVKRRLPQVSEDDIRRTLSSRSVRELIESNIDKQSVEKELENWKQTKPQNYALQTLKKI